MYTVKHYSIRMKNKVMSPAGKWREGRGKPGSVLQHLQDLESTHLENNKLVIGSGGRALQNQVRADKKNRNHREIGKLKQHKEKNEAEGTLTLSPREGDLTPHTR